LPPTTDTMFRIDTDQLCSVLNYAESVASALQALRDATDQDDWDALCDVPAIDVLLSACCDLEDAMLTGEEE
jgi:hypothetical protein